MVNVSAAENADGSSSFVEDTDIRNWSTDPIGNTGGDVDLQHGIYCFHTKGQVISGSSSRLHLYSKVSPTSISADKTYSFKVSFPSYDVFKKYYFPNFDEAWYLNQFEYFDYFAVGLGYLDSNGSFSFLDDYYYIFNADTITSSFNEEMTWSFKMSDFKGKTPYFGITVGFASPLGNHYFYFNQPEFIDESKAEEDGFFSRLFQWFQEKFDNLKSWFSDLSDSIGGFFLP